MHKGKQCPINAPPGKKLTMPKSKRSKGYTKKKSKKQLSTVYLYLVLDSYIYTWKIGSRTRLEHYRICRYKEIDGDPDKTWTWYLPWPNSYCSPYVVHQEEA